VERETLILTAPEVASLLDLRTCIEAVEEAFDALGRGSVAPPSVLGVHVPSGGFHIKAGTLAVGSRAYFAAKANANFPSNPDRVGLPSIQGVLVLCDAEVGTPLLVADSSRLTELRTAAATAVAARHLSRPVSSVATLVGCGAQAFSQLGALGSVRRLRRVILIDRVEQRAVDLAARLRDASGVEVEIGRDLGAAVASSDIVVTCTTSREPIVLPDMLRPGTFVAAVGADNPEKCEVAPDVMAQAKVVVDSVGQCADIGDLRHAIASGAMRVEDVHAELGSVVAGASPGREADDEVIVFDSTGLGLQDVAAAVALYRRAERGALGLRLALAGR